jgi:hypothetical protein
MQLPWDPLPLFLLGESYGQRAPFFCRAFDGVDDFGHTVAIFKGCCDRFGLLAAGQSEHVVGLVGEAFVPPERVRALDAAGKPESFQRVSRAGHHLGHGPLAGAADGEFVEPFHIPGDRAFGAVDLKFTSVLQ